MPEFQGRVAVVTGGGRGLGEAVCKKLSEYGATVAVTDIDLEAAAAVAATFNAAGRRAKAYELDVTSWTNVHEIVRDIEADLGPIDVLVSNAGVSHSIRFLEIDEAEWDRIVDTNLKGLFIVLRAVIPGMVERRIGRVVSIGSISSKAAYPRFAHYTASKFGALGLAQVVAAEVAPFNVTINTVCPGVMNTPMQHSLVKQMLVSEGGDFASEEEAEAWFISQLPLGVAQPAEDVAEMVAYLASDLARNMTAGSYHVDGGMTPR
jgi:meso-butanediol dehydrogenase / (S,S)-butanediol dehydrogenase / diacetyl reductase